MKPVLLCLAKVEKVDENNIIGKEKHKPTSVYFLIYYFNSKNQETCQDIVDSILIH